MLWSPDSRWLTYARPTKAGNSAIFLYDTRAAKLHQATTGYLNDTQPTFEPEGKYLIYASDREFDPVYGSFDNTWTYPNPTRLVAVPLRRDVKSPLAARNNDENSMLDTGAKKDEPKKPEEKKAEDAQTEQKPAEKPADEQKADDKPVAPPIVEIDVDGFEARAVVLPPKAGNYADVQAIKGKLLYRRQPRTGSGDEKSAIVYFDFAEREEKTVLDDADAFEATADGKKMLVINKKKYAILDIKAGGVAGRSSRRVAADLPRRLPVRTRFLLRPQHARGELGGAGRALQQGPGRGGDPVGRRFPDRRVHRGVECVAHLSRRRRHGAGAAAIGRPLGR
jgi:tricorn protease